MAVNQSQSQSHSPFLPLFAWMSSLSSCAQCSFSRYCWVVCLWCYPRGVSACGSWSFKVQPSSFLLYDVVLSLGPPYMHDAMLCTQCSSNARTCESCANLYSSRRTPYALGACQKTIAQSIAAHIAHNITSGCALHREVKSPRWCTRPSGRHRIHWYLSSHARARLRHMCIHSARNIIIVVHATCARESANIYYMVVRYATDNNVESSEYCVNHRNNNDWGLTICFKKNTIFCVCCAFVCCMCAACVCVCVLLGVISWRCSCACVRDVRAYTRSSALCLHMKITRSEWLNKSSCLH